MKKEEITEEIVNGVIQLGGGEKGFHQETIQECYDNVADKYEKLMIMMGHPDPD